MKSPRQPIHKRPTSANVAGVVFGSMLSAAAALTCSKETPESTPAKSEPPVAINNGQTQSALDPTKEAAIETMKALLVALESNDWSRARSFVLVPPNVDAAEIEQSFAGVIERREISATGIDLLAANGAWGKLSDVLPKVAKNLGKENPAVNLSDCYGLALEPAEAGFQWTDDRFLIVRLDDVGKLTAQPKVPPIPPENPDSVAASAKCQENLKFIYSCLLEHQAASGRLPKSSGAALLADLVKAGRVSEKDVDKLSCPAVGSSSLAIAPTDWASRLSEVDNACTAYAVRDQVAFPLRKLPGNGSEALVSDRNQGRCNHSDGKTHVLYDDGTIRILSLTELASTGVIPKDAVSLLPGPDSPIPALQCLDVQ